MSKNEPDELLANIEACKKAANRLHHLSMRYSGSIMELASGLEVGIIPQSQAGLRETRDLIDLLLFTRAEINGLTNILFKAGIVTQSDLQKEFAEQYEWFAQQKAGFLNVEVTDFGISFKCPTPQEQKPPTSQSQN